MQPFEALSEEDCSNIKKYIEYYATNSTYGPSQVSVEMPYLLRFWNKNKQFLFELFNNELILQKDINIQYPEAFLIEEMEDLLDQQDGKFIREMSNFINKLAVKENYTYYSNLYRLIEPKTLVSNIYPGDTVEIPYTLNDGTLKRLTVPSGCKIMKMLSKIANIFNLNGFEEFRLKHSMVLNRKKFKGTVCLSIHPLDYMTMSDNDCDWDSCMSWREDGDYRLGTVEMMNSQYIVVAYLKSKTDMDLFENRTTQWNNKRWRQLFMVSDKMIFGIKGYPYNDDILTDVILDWLLDLFKLNKPECIYLKDKFTISNRKNNKFLDKNIHLSFNFNAMYNDIYGKHLCYITKEFYDNIENYGAMFGMNLSGETECMFCGDDWTLNYEHLDTNFLCCPDCSGVIRCPECGDFVNQEEIHELDDGSLMCEACFEYYCGYCVRCGSSFRSSDLIDIDAYGYENDSKYIGTICYCRDCMQENAYQNDIGPIELDDRYGYRVKASNFTEDGFALFGIFNINTIKEIQSSKTNVN